MRLSYKYRIKPFFDGSQPTFGGVLLSLLIRLYGIEAMDWDPTTIRMEVQDDLECRIPGRVFDQLQAALTLVTTDIFYTEVESFDSICRALCRKRLQTFSSFPVARDIAWAVTEARLLDPEPVHQEDDETPYSIDVQTYIALALKSEGIHGTPKSLQTVKIDHMMQNNSAVIPSSYEADPIIFSAFEFLRATTSDAIDTDVAHMLTVYAKQLDYLGFKESAKIALKLAAKYAPSVLLPKQAEWTSEENKERHVQKHAPEFGGRDQYLAQEELHAQVPAADETVKDIRCSPDDCTVALYSDSRGTVYVQRLSDGRTVTLYKRNKRINTQPRLQTTNDVSS